MFEQAREFKLLHKTNPLTKSTGTSIPNIITTSPSTTTPITSTTTTYTLFLEIIPRLILLLLLLLLLKTITTTTTTTDTTTNIANITTNTNTLFLLGGLNSTWDNAFRQYLVHLLCFLYMSACGMGRKGTSAELLLSTTI